MVSLDQTNVCEDADGFSSGNLNRLNIVVAPGTDPWGARVPMRAYS